MEDEYQQGKEKKKGKMKKIDKKKRKKKREREEEKEEEEESRTEVQVGEKRDGSLKNFNQFHHCERSPGNCRGNLLRP